MGKILILTLTLVLASACAQKNEKAAASPLFKSWTRTISDWNGNPTPGVLTISGSLSQGSASLRWTEPGESTPEICTCQVTFSGSETSGTWTQSSCVSQSSAIGMHCNHMNGGTIGYTADGSTLTTVESGTSIWTSL